jgi:ubiquinol oxidase
MDRKRTRISQTRESLDGAHLDLTRHHAPRGFRERLAYVFVKGLRLIADIFFAGRYGHRAVVLETVAGVPGMVGAALQHLHCLRRMHEDDGWIFALLDEAENERMHLMTFMDIIRPTWFERLVVVLVQGAFYNAFFLLYLLSARTAHRVVGYMEEEAVISYNAYLKHIDEGRDENVPAPEIAIEYWNLPANSRLRDVILVIRADEVEHRDVNHGFADALSRKGGMHLHEANI